MPAPTFITADDLSLFRHAELVARSVIDGFVNGIHRSPYKGFAIDFSHYREYTRGDEMKHLDWNVYARSDKFYVKQYDEYAVLKAYILLDASGSMNYGSGEHTKLHFAKFLAGLLTHILISQKDSVAFATFDHETRFFLPPACNSTQQRKIIEHLAGLEAGGETSMHGIMEHLSACMKKRGLVILISDLFDQPDVIAGTLKHFSKRRHEIIVFRILDPAERDFPFRKFAKFIDMETGNHLFTDPVRIRTEYMKKYEELDTTIRQACYNLAIDYIPVFTDQSPAKALARYLHLRAKRK